MLAFERAQGKAQPLPPAAARRSRVAITFLVVCLSWVFFRAKTLGQALVYLRSLFGLAATTPASDVVAGALYTPLSRGDVR